MPRFERCVVFHSLSKRSSVPGLRSGFVAGDPALLKAVPALSHVPRLRDAAADSAGQRARLERRRACRRQPRPVPAEVRAKWCPILSGLLDVDTPGGRLLLLAAGRRRRALHARSCSNEQTRHACCPAATSPATRPRGNPGRGRVRISLVRQRRGMRGCGAPHREFLLIQALLLNEPRSEFISLATSPLPCRTRHLPP